MRYFHVTPIPLPSSSLLFHPPKIKKCGFENKYLLTICGSTSARNPPTLLRKNPQTPRKKFISEVFFFTSEVKQPFFLPKKRREPACLGLSPLFYDKDNTFSAEIQIALTFRNTPQTSICSDLQQTGSDRCYITRGERE